MCSWDASGCDHWGEAVFVWGRPRGAAADTEDHLFDIYELAFGGQLRLLPSSMQYQVFTLRIFMRASHCFYDVGAGDVCSELHWCSKRMGELRGCNFSNVNVCRDWARMGTLQVRCCCMRHVDGISFCRRKGRLGNHGNKDIFYGSAAWHDLIRTRDKELWQRSPRWCWNIQHKRKTMQTWRLAKSCAITLLIVPFSTLHHDPYDYDQNRRKQESQCPLGPESPTSLKKVFPGLPARSAKKVLNKVPKGQGPEKVAKLCQNQCARSFSTLLILPLRAGKPRRPFRDFLRILGLRSLEAPFCGYCDCNRIMTSEKHVLHICDGRDSPKPMAASSNASSWGTFLARLSHGSYILKVVPLISLQNASIACVPSPKKLIHIKFPSILGMTPASYT